MKLTQKQSRMRTKNSVGHPTCTERKVVPKIRPQRDWIGAKTKRHLMREGLETHVRDLKARLDQFEGRKREQHERHYATEIRYVTPHELSEMSRYQR